MNIALFLEQAAQAAPHRIALVGDGQQWTYAELRAAARGACAVIAQNGCNQVALLDESSAAAVIALFGAALAGAAYCPLNYRLADQDLSAMLSRMGPTLIVGDEPRIIRLVGGLGHSAGHTLFSRGQFMQKLPEAALTATHRQDDPGTDDAGAIAVQLFTSGTTAVPKAALLRHAHLLAYIRSTVEYASAQANDCALIAVPPYHIAGIAVLLGAIHAQRRIVMLPRFTPEDWVKLVAREQVTHAFVVPTMLSQIMGSLGRGEHVLLASLRAVTYGAGKMPLELIAQALDLLPHTDFTNAYGLTETCSAVALLRPDDHRAAQRAADPQVRARLGSVGKPLPTIALEIRDEAGRVLPAGQAGEIYVRGEQVSGEYAGRSALDAQGWFATRDAGYRDEHGYLYLLGRADDVIVRGGENISPGEIEDVLLTHPAIADACAVAVPSARWGEGIGIAIVLREGHPCPGEDPLKQLIRDRLRSSRVPDRVLVVTELPYNELGKLLRREVRKRLAG